MPNADQDLQPLTLAFPSPCIHHRGRTASSPTAPAPIPACGCLAPGSSALRAAARRLRSGGLPASSVVVRRCVVGQLCSAPVLLGSCATDHGGGGDAGCATAAHSAGPGCSTVAGWPRSRGLRSPWRTHGAWRAAACSALRGVDDAAPCTPRGSAAGRSGVAGGPSAACGDRAPCGPCPIDTHTPDTRSGFGRRGGAAGTGCPVSGRPSVPVRTALAVAPARCRCVPPRLGLRTRPPKRRRSASDTLRLDRAVGPRWHPTPRARRAGTPWRVRVTPSPRAGSRSPGAVPVRRCRAPRLAATAGCGAAGRQHQDAPRTAVPSRQARWEPSTAGCPLPPPRPRVRLGA